jgi:hypothetical protein
VSLRRVACLAASLPLFVACGSAVASPQQTARARRAIAVGVAKQLLDAVVLPAGTSEVRSEPSGDQRQLARPVMQLFFAAQVDLARFWTSSASPRAVIQSLKSHPPAGATPLGSGFAGSTEYVAFTLPRVERGVLGARQLSVTATPVSGGLTGVRADGEVQYIAPRTRAQQIPPRARVLQIEQTRGVGTSSRTLLALTVTNRRVVRAVARMIDALPFEGSPFGPVAVACPAILTTAPLDTFTFRGAPGGRVLAKLSERADTPADAGLCAEASLIVRGHREPGVLDGGTMLREAGALLHVKLTARR